MDGPICGQNSLYRLPSGYGRERNETMFHGDMIFWDAASKIIHVENQVSHGAGETLASKESFEQCLWEISRARVKHFHSNTTKRLTLLILFASAEFHEQFKEDQQSQSFSGVGAQHQKAEAERSIRMVLYMACSFMIHVALHWGEDQSDDLLLWSFAVD